ncbi:Fe3+ hydroxamate ABC transporter substrate-binding protein [Bacillus sp. Y1]|nr:Fe3+ hydroxamate ABC transporter substrate-binding protein [Bacillus sp. Y1]AYA76127.1 Fe3+ hydroxamate ABC transporter substrate-binding protein [Bacillus sp. Y1]
MFKVKPQCSNCSKEIKGNEVVYVKMRYPERKGMTEITAFLRNEGQLICEDCFNNKPY